VPSSESVDKIKALREEKVYYEQLVFPDEVHGFLLHQSWVDAYKATVDFFDRMLE
jgi:dipeptidyl aminopeptidase/acylaminoacyl peptidase